jgi:hypothetical protein
MEEALFATTQLPNYGSTLSAFSIEAPPVSNSTFRDGNGSRIKSGIFHIIVYQTKPSDNGLTKVEVAVWNDERPPQRIIFGN